MKKHQTADFFYGNSEIRDLGISAKIKVLTVRKSHIKRGIIVENV